MMVHLLSTAARSSELFASILVVAPGAVILRGLCCFRTLAYMSSAYGVFASELSIMVFECCAQAANFQQCVLWLKVAEDTFSDEICAVMCRGCISTCHRF